MLSTLFETLPVGVVAEDSDRNVLAVNDHLLDLFELPGAPEDVHGADCVQMAEQVSDMFVESNRFVERINQLVSDREPTDNEQLVFHDDRIFERDYRPVELPDGDGHLWVYKDISEQDEQRRRYEAVFNQTYQFTGLLEPDGTVLEANDTVLEFGGLDRDEVVGQNMWELPLFQNSQATRDRAQSAVERAADGDFVHHELRLQGTDREAIIDFSVRPVTDEQGSVRFLVPEGHEITDRKEHERALQRERDRLDEFAGVLSHDLRNPLNLAEARLEFVQEECDSEHLPVIETALDRMDRLTEDALWLAREGREIGSLDAVVLHDTIDTAWNIVADNASHAELHYADDGFSTATIEADDDRLGRLLENLFRNAIEHGGNEVTVTVGTMDDGFYVEDDGPGLPEERRDSVFTAGYSASEDGTGFGLSIVKQVAEAHGWDVGLTESEAGGARFDITGVETTSTDE
ncbi:PAS domain-containing sensor histidine kinase [Haloplanus sp. GCM10025708]|uniref:PAS domain-containing sensor histidine kinase n=1 Tax=Haloplanus sp. GCM10025708 TaxID=3252679 RepID=UPI00360D099C